jgi:hypothetical protein
MANKRLATKSVEKKNVSISARFTVVRGALKRGRGRPDKVRSLFKVVAEKLPYESIDDVRKDLELLQVAPNGVYVAHDSMGYARYVGRGKIFSRLKTHRKAHPELLYFSFYVVENKSHEREIETLAIRAAGPQLHFNTRKRRVDIAPGSVKDFEAGTRFYERQGRRGRPKRPAR